LSFDFPDRICLNDWVSFWNTSSWQFNKFEWFVNGEKVSSSNGFGKKFSEAGTYLISLIGSINGTDCKQGIYTYVTIQAPLDIVGPTQVCPESEGVIYELVGGEDLNTINWSFWGGASTLTPNHDELTIDFGKWISNSDNIVASYSDKNGCLNQTIFDININCEQPLPSASLQGLALEVNPNPIASNSVLGFKYEEEAPVNVQLYDMNGKLIADLFNQNQFIGQGRIELGSIFNQIESGVYLIKLSNGSTVKSIQIVK
jgi:hypothetical protein